MAACSGVARAGARSPRKLERLALWFLKSEQRRAKRAGRNSRSLASDSNVR